MSLHSKIINHKFIIHLIVQYLKILSVCLTIAISFAPMRQWNYLAIASEPSRLTSSMEMRDIEQLIVNGEITKAISILEGKLEKSREKKNTFEQIRILHKLQVANYCRGAMRRSLVNGNQIIQLVEDLKKVNQNVNYEFQSYEVDAMLLHHKTSIEIGSISLSNQWIASLHDLENGTNDLKIRAKIYLGLAYLYKNIEIKKEAKRAEDYFSRLSRISIDNLSMEPLEKFSFLLTYADVIKAFNSNPTMYVSGINTLDLISRKYSQSLPAITPYLKIKIAALHNLLGNFKTSLATLNDNYRQIERIPQHFKLLTLELMGDNTASIGEYLQSGGHYTQILMDTEKTQNSLGSDFVNIYLSQKVSIKEIRVRFKRVGKLGGSDIMELMRASAELPYPYDLLTAQKWLDNLTTDNSLIQSLFLDKGSVWNAFAVSELTRTQIMRFHNQSSNERYSVRLEPLLSLPVTEDSRTPEGFQIAGRDSMFPVASQQLASIISSQSKGVTQNDRTTIVEYSYDFKDNPSEIYIYIFRPEKNLLKVKPISLCINLVPSNQNGKCKATLTAASNSTDLEAFRTATKSINGSSLRTYINNGVASIINCRNDVSTKANNCNKTDAFLRQLYQLLIQPVSEFLPSNPAEKVVFVPQGDLFSVPFTALKDGNGKYLIEKATISTVPSIFLLGKADEIYNDLSKVKNKKSLIIGNPTIYQEQNNQKKLSNLPFAETEANQIAKMYGVNALIGASATKEKIFESLESTKGIKVLHLATHASIETENSLDSTIVISPSAKNPGGRLKLSEIPDRANVELVVLSACDSGKGKISTDGIASFSSKLITSGNPTQVVSLWAINDNSTTEIMVNFHGNSLQGESTTQALRQSMLKAMKANIEPYYWAPFTLIGNTQ
jgi:CHAT domain-containing protein